MSSNKQRPRRSQPYVQKIDLGNNRRIRRIPPKLCPECKQTTSCIKLILSRLNKIEEIINDCFSKNFQTKDDLAPMDIDDPSDYSLYCLEDCMDWELITSNSPLEK